MFSDDSQETIAVSVANGSNPWIDRLVIRRDLGGKIIDYLIRASSPAGSPVPLALQRDAVMWEISLTQINVPANATSIAAGNVVDASIRMYADWCLANWAGWWYVPVALIQRPAQAEPDHRVCLPIAGGNGAPSETASPAQTRPKIHLAYLSTIGMLFDLKDMEWVTEPDTEITPAQKATKSRLDDARREFARTLHVSAFGEAGQPSG